MEKLFDAPPRTAILLNYFGMKYSLQASGVQPAARVPLVARVCALSDTHKATIYKCRQPGIYHFLDISSSVSVSCTTRHGPAILLQIWVDIHLLKISFHHELGKNQHRSILSDHHLKNLLVLAISSMNPNIELLVNGKDIQRP